MAWCYGDLGVASALWLAGNSLNDNCWKEKAIEILLHNTTRVDAADTGIKDAGLCHGTAGIAHIFNRAYCNTGVQEFKNAALYWFQKTADMAVYKDGLAGYKTWSGPDKQYINETSLLEGIAGIGLAFIGAVHPQCIGWDECLLLS
jgi:lantibiotic modifying enzyme